VLQTVTFGDFVQKWQKTPKMAKNPVFGQKPQIWVLTPKSDILGVKIARIIFGVCPLKGGFLKTRFKTPNNAMFRMPPHHHHNHPHPVWSQTTHPPHHHPPS